MKNLSLITLMAAMMFLVISCTSPPAEPVIDMEAVKADITQINENWAAAINANDLEGQLAIFADDAQIMPPNSPAVVGKDAIKARIEARIAKDTSDANTTLAFATTDLWAVGDMVAETGTWTFAGEDGAMLNKGKYIVLFEKRDGKYVCIRDIWNSDMPKKEAPIAEADTEAASEETEE